jgi:hypothetical protein
MVQKTKAHSRDDDGGQSYSIKGHNFLQKVTPRRADASAAYSSRLSNL